MQSVGIQNTVARNTPDHSILSWKINIDICLQTSSKFNEKAPSFDKFNLGKVPDLFLSDDSIISKVNDHILRLEQGLRLRLQSDIDTAYDGWCDLVRIEMYDKLSYKTINTFLLRELENLRLGGTIVLQICLKMFKWLKGID